MRGQGKQTWVKLHINGMLNGSVRYQLEPAERATWVDLVLFAALGPDPGLISDNDRRPYPHSFLANRFNIPLELFETTLRKCAEEGRVSEEAEGIRITNWVSYQSEYHRQKPSRQAKRKQSLIPGGLGVDFEQRMVAKFSTLGPSLIHDQIDLALSHVNAKKYGNTELYVQNWLRREAEHRATTIQHPQQDSPSIRESPTIPQKPSPFAKYG